MLKNYFKVAIRNLIRNKAFSFINIFGLAIGLTTCLLIMLYIFDESSYDGHYKDADRIYRIETVSPNGEGLPSWAAGPGPLAGGLKTDLPEVEQATRILILPDLNKMLFKVGQGTEGKQIFETNGYYVDSTFFRVLSYEFRYGDALTALNRPNSLVISPQISTALFGNANPIGKTIKIGLPFGEYDYTVQGVLKDKKTKSHIPANFFLSMRNGDVGGWAQNQTNWASNNLFYTYVKLREGSDPAVFKQKLVPFMERRAGPDLKAMGISKTLFAEPLKDIYLHSALENEIAPNGNIQYLYILGSIAVFILLIACINFMNLSTARSGERAREVGVRKVMGAGKGSLIRQFLGESFVLCLMALALALLLTGILLPYFNSLTGKSMRLFDNPGLLLWILGLTLLTGLFSGIYPAFYLSAFKPVLVLKGKILNSFSAAIIRRGLVVFQFSVSICLIVGAIIISQQLQFVKNRHLGFNKEQQLILPMRSDHASKNFAALKSELLNNPHVAGVTSGSSYPGIPTPNSMLFYAEGKTIKDVVDINISAVGDDYLETLGFTLLAGRSFSKEFTADSSSIILNEQSLGKLGYDSKNAVGKNIYFDYQNVHHTMHVVGVVRDFHFESLHNKIKPFGFVTEFFGDKRAYTIVRLKTNDYAGLLGSIIRSWNKINPGLPFDYSFLDQDFQRNYEKEERTAQMVGYFTIVAILIACLGLFGLSAFSAEQRTKEMGIRKVLGASVLNLTSLLSKDFIRLVLVSIVVGSPLAWYGMHKWLQNFAYQIPIKWWVFALAGFLVVLIALITVSFQATKTALANPTNNLRTE
ncbi:MAG: ABC transporter permease [Puia sp.]|nr:ABC transporter permease [Puia sp.]